MGFRRKPRSRTTKATRPSASLSDIYSQPATLMDLPPYEYGAEAPYYWPPDYPTEPYCYTDDYPYSWCPDFGFGFVGFADFGHGFGFDRHHEGFGGRFEHQGSGAIWSGNGVWRSDGASARQFDATADPKPRDIRTHVLLADLPQ